MPLNHRILVQHGGRAIAAAAVLAVLVLFAARGTPTAQAAVGARTRFSPPSGLPAALPLAPPPVTAALATTGTVVADTGFRPKVDGFSFRNYDGGSNLTGAALQRLFGPDVCAGGQDAPCLLTPAAEQWMGHYNRLMAAGGHCYGFSTLSQLFMCNPIFGGVTLAKFGSPEMKDDLLPKLVAGKAKFAMALTEPDAGTNSLALKTFARADGNGWRLSGQKIWITCVPQAIILSAQNEPCLPVSPCTRTRCSRRWMIMPPPLPPDRGPTAPGAHAPG